MNATLENLVAVEKVNPNVVTNEALNAIAAEVHTMREEGLTWKEIAEMMGTGEDTHVLYVIWKSAGYHRNA